MSKTCFHQERFNYLQETQNRFPKGDRFSCYGKVCAAIKDRNDNFKNIQSFLKDVQLLGKRRKINKFLVNDCICIILHL